MQITPYTLRRIREYRVDNDPVIPHYPRRDWLDTFDQFGADIQSLRNEQLATAPSDRPIKQVTWTELLVWCGTASFDATMAGEDLLGIYQLAFEKHLAEINQSDDKFELPLSNYDTITLTERHKDLAEKQKALLKKIQNRVFLESEYDEIPFNTDGVPKEFWKSHAIGSTLSNTTVDTSEKETSTTDSSQQMGLDMY